MTDATGGAVSPSSPSARDLEALGSETELNGVSSGESASLESFEDGGEGRSFGAATGAGAGGDMAGLGASASGTFGGGAQASGGTSAGGETGSNRARLLQDGKDVAAAKAQQARQWAGEFSSRQTETFKSRVTEKPVETSVAVFGLGLIVGLLLRR